MANEIYKTVEIDGEQFVITKFTAIEGMQIVRLALAKLSPIIPFLEGKPEQAMDDNFVMAFAAAIGALTDDEVDKLIKKCLKCCSKMMPAGKQPIVDATGHYGVEGIEYDLPKVMALCVEAIKWGCADFFGEKVSALIAPIMAQVSSLSGQ